MKLKVISFTVLVVLILGAAGVAVTYIGKHRRNRQVLEHISAAEQALNENDQNSARRHLQDIVEYYEKSLAAPKASYLLAKIGFEQCDYANSRKYSEILLSRYPDSEYVAWAEFYRAEALLNLDKELAEAEDVFNRLADSKTSPEEIVLRSEFGKARLVLKKGKIADARKRLAELLEAENLPLDLKNQVEIVLGNVNLQMLFSPEIADGDQVYSLKTGDTLYELARKFKVPQELLMKCNQIKDARMLKVGRQIKIPRGDYSINVDKSTNVLTLYSGGKFFKKYLVRTGRYDYLTPEGSFKIEYKKENPEWVDPRSHKKYPPNDPENELGTRWMSFKGSALGIHGTIHPDTIGQYASQGCVGMLMEDVEELYDIVPVGTPVIIVGKARKTGDTENE